MTKTISLICLCTVLAALSHCNGDGPPPPKKAKGIVAIVYADLTKSIDEDIANRQKKNIGELFQRLPANTKFFLYSIDRGSNKPDIYEFAPRFIEVKEAKDVDTLKQQIEKAKKDKETSEGDNLNASLNAYYSFITSQKGPVSCIANKLNSLLDTVGNAKASFRDHEIRLFFYSDMIEQCQNSFDGKPADFETQGNDQEEVKHLQDIQQRIEQSFAQAGPEKNLKSMGAKVYIVLTSQDDKQNLKSLKTIWNTFFGKLGLQPDDLIWANRNEELFWDASKIERL